MLNRIISGDDKGWKYEADQRHGEIIVAAMGMPEGNGVTSPTEETGKEVDPSEAVELATDRADLQYAERNL